MADNVLGVHIQGVSDEGNPVEDGFPVVVAFEDAAGNKEVPNIGPAGGVQVEGIVGAQGIPVSGTVTANQGAPNVGGSQAWPVLGKKDIIRTNTGLLVNAGDSVAIDCHDADTVWFSLSGSYTGTIIVEAQEGAGPFTSISFYSQSNGHLQFLEYPDQLNDLIGIGTTNYNNIQVTAAPGFVGTPSVSVQSQVTTGVAFPILGGNIAFNTTRITTNGIDKKANPITIGEFTGASTVLDSYEVLYTVVIPCLAENLNTVTPQRTPTINKQATATVAGSTALWTPAAGKKFRLMRYMLVVTDDATQAAPGRVTVKLLDGATDIGQNHITFVPAVGLLNTGALYTSGWIDLGNGILSAAINTTLNINLSAALTAGVVNVLVCGTEE